MKNCALPVLPPDGRCALTRAKHFSTNYAEAWLHITHDCSVLFVHVSTDRQDTAACVSLSFLYNVKEPEDCVKPSRHQSRQNTTGPSYLAPDVHFDRSWKRPRVCVDMQPSVRGFICSRPRECQGWFPRNFNSLGRRNLPRPWPFHANPHSAAALQPKL